MERGGFTMTIALFHQDSSQTISVGKSIKDGQASTKNRVRRTIRLCSGPGFGSSGHPTTRSCLKCLGRLLRYFSPENVLDAGTGNAILAIAAILWGAEKVVAVEIQPKVIKTAKRNLILNGVQDQVWLCCADALLIPGQYDLVIMNLNPGSYENVDIFTEAHLVTGGYCIISGLSGFERDRVFRRLVIKGPLNVLDEIRDSGWTTFLFHKA
jgi:ribosomal protein L11 methyltransferase